MDISKLPNEIQSTIQKYQNGNLGVLKPATLQSNNPFDEMLNDAITNMFDSLSGNTLSDAEKNACGNVFVTAVLNQIKDQPAIDTLNELFKNSLAYYEDEHVKDVFTVQMLKKHKLPLPSSQVLYVPSDIIDACKAYCVSKDPKDKEYILANIGAFFIGIPATHLIFDDDTDYQKWLSNVNADIANNPTLNPVNNNIASIISDGIIIRSSYDITAVENQEDSMARIISKHVTAYPFAIYTNVIETVMPTKIIVWNIAKTARAATSELLKLKSELTQLDQSIDMSRVLSFSAIANLNEIQQQISNARQQSTRLQQLLSNINDMAASGKVGKKKYTMKKFDMMYAAKKVMDIEKKMHDVFISKNIKITTAESYQRPNRRDNDNPDLPGTVQIEGFYPDIHVYVDTSGSISTEDYINSISMIANIVKKLDCDLYFNSFTTDISQETIITCRNKSIEQIKKEVEKIPKISGGTSIDQVWSYINATKKNQKQLSIIISDFEVGVPNHIPHPKNLWYIPTKNAMKSEIEYFMNNLDQPWRMIVKTN